jgi:hypothetical protein
MRFVSVPGKTSRQLRHHLFGATAAQMGNQQKNLYPRRDWHEQILNVSKGISKRRYSFAMQLKHNILNSVSP